MKKKRFTVHWLENKETKVAACGVSNQHLVFNADPEQVSCNNCLRKSSVKKIPNCTTHHICDCLNHQLKYFKQEDKTLRWRIDILRAALSFYVLEGGDDAGETGHQALHETKD